MPLVVELSADARTWKEVARHVEPFDVWSASLGGAKARYVRLRVAGRTMLHLRRVAIR